MDSVGFCSACGLGDLSTIAAWLEQNLPQDLQGAPEVQQHLARGFDAACRNGHVEAVQMLLAANDTLQLDVRAALGLGQAFVDACAGGHIGVLAILLGVEGDHRVDVRAVGKQALVGACRGGHADVVQLLLDLDGDRSINMRTAGLWACAAACRGGHMSTVQLLLGLHGDRQINVCAAGEAALADVCGAGHVPVVLFLLLGLDGDARINVHDPDVGPCAFELACRRGHAEVVQLLMDLDGDRRIDVGDCLHGALVSACGEGHDQVLQTLLNLHGEGRICIGTQVCGEQAFVRACEGGHARVVQRLLALTGDLRISLRTKKVGLTALKRACKHGFAELAEVLLRVSDERRILGRADVERIFVYACARDRGNLAHKLLSLDRNRNSDLRAAWHWGVVHACNKGCVDVLSELLSYDIGHMPSEDRDKNQLWRKAYTFACGCNKPDVVRLLLELDTEEHIDLSASGPRWVFERACRSGHVDLVQLLLDLTGTRRVNVHAADEAAFTAACAGGHVQMVQLLLKLHDHRYIDVHAREDAAFVAACANGCVGVVQLLLRLEGDRCIDVHARWKPVFLAICSNNRVDVMQMLLTLSADRGFSWHAAEQQSVLCDSLLAAILAQPPRIGMLQVLLQHVPLPARWLATLASHCLQPLQPQSATAAQPPPAQMGVFHELTVDVSSAQQVVLWVLNEQAKRPRGQHWLPLGAGANTALDVLAAWVVLQPRSSAALRSVCLHSLGNAQTALALLGRMRQLVWRGIRIPLVPAPGVHLLLTAQAGGLGRPGRRGLLLHRAAARAARTTIKAQSD